MISSKIIFLIALALPIKAANTDDEIIKNLDFFQNMDIVKDESTYINIALNKTSTEKPLDTSTKEKNNFGGIDLEKQK